MTLTVRLLTLAALGALVGARPASAAFFTYDLTGTWSGSLTCNAFVGGVKQKTVRTPIMRISQAGFDIGVQLDFGAGTSRYAGLANPDTKKPELKGETALILCGTDNELGVDAPDEIARMSASTKTGKVKASLKGLSFFSNPQVSAPNHGTCKWKWTRIDTVDPLLPTRCDEPSLHLPPGAQARGGAR